MAILVAIGTFFHERIWLSKKSTILGLLVFVGGEVLNYLGALPNMPASAHLIVSLISAPFLLWRDQAVKDGTIKLLAFLLCASLGATAAPNAEALKDAVVSDPAAVQPGADVLPPPIVDPRFGGCLKSGKLCFGPSVALTFAAINLKTKVIEGAFQPGIGYGLTFNPGKFYSLGADVYFAVDPAAQKASFAVMASLLNGYFRVGASKGVIGDVAWRIPLAAGLGLGF